MREIARQYLSAGLSVLPIRMDGSKAPMLNEWTPLQQIKMTVDDWPTCPCGIGIIGGAVSGNLEILDFDKPGAFDEWLAILPMAGDGLTALVATLPVVETPDGGRHVFYRCAEIQGAQKLARAKVPYLGPYTGKPKTVIIETKGEGGYVVAPPSPSGCHDAKRPYRQLPGTPLTSIPKISVAQRKWLLQAARTFDEVQATPEARPAQQKAAKGTRPGDEYNATATWPSILEPAGWVSLFDRGPVTYWRRPGKEGRGISATTGACGDNLYVFSSNATPFDPERSYDKFGAYVLLNHGGDFRAASEKLRPHQEEPPLAEPPEDWHEPVQETWENIPYQPTIPATDNPKTDDAPKAIMVSLASVEPKRLRWLWPGRIPFGKVALLDGDPGLGKSLVTIDLTARVTRGEAMPDGSFGDVDGPAGVVIMSVEDDPEDTIRPRADAAGTDCQRVRLLTGVEVCETSNRGQKRRVIRSMTLCDIEAIRQAIKEVNASLVIIDPLMAYLGGDAHRDQDVRQALAPLAKLAAETEAAILVVRHLNKSGGGSPIYRGGGSIGIIGAARAGLMVAKDPEDQTGSRRILALTKTNLSKGSTPSLAYEVIDADDVAKIKWLGVDQHTADSLLSAPVDEEEKGALNDACDWLRNQLSGGEEMSKNLQTKANSDGVSWRTVERAKSKLGVVAGRSGISGKWFWRLPELRLVGDDHTNTLGGLGGHKAHT